MQLVMGSALTSGALIQIGGRACYFGFIVIVHYRLGFPVDIQFFFEIKLVLGWYYLLREAVPQAYNSMAETMLANIFITVFHK